MILDSQPHVPTGMLPHTALSGQWVLPIRLPPLLSNANLSWGHRADRSNTYTSTRSEYQLCHQSLAL